MKNLFISLLALAIFSCSEQTPVEPPAVEPKATEAAPELPNIKRIKIATVGTQDVDVSKNLYAEWLDYSVVEEGLVSEELANHWGTPASAGKPYAVMQGKSGDDVYLRVIEVTTPENYRAMTTYGWNAIELIVEDPDAIHQKLLDSPFEHVGGPANLGGGSSIRAVQFKGPSEELFYFTTDTGDRSKSSLLTPRVDIDRPFIMVVAGPDPRALTDFYVSNFGGKEAFFIQTPINIISTAQQLPADHLFTMGFVRLGDFSNSIEIDTRRPPDQDQAPTVSCHPACQSPRSRLVTLTR